MATLAEEEREAIALRFGADLTVPEIAAVLELPLIDGRGPRVPRAAQAAGSASDPAVAWAVDRARRGCSGALYPQSALAGLNSLPREAASGVSAPIAASMAGSRPMSAREPGQVRKEAALSGHR